MNGTLTIQATEGLANRMRAVASGYTLAKHHKKQFIIIWEQSYGMNCDFFDLFDLIPEINIKNSSQNQKLKDSNNKNFIRKNIIRFLNKYYGYDTCLINETSIKNFRFNEQLQAKELNGKKNIYIRTCHQLAPIKEWFFQPRQELKNIIKKRKEIIGKNTVGLHIRRTDNRKSIEKSPLSLFIEAIKEEIKNDSTIKFYLATDSKDISTALIEIFGEYILYFPCNLDRNSKEGVQDALIELYTLASTKKVYGSYWSSFSETAAALGEIELITLSEF